MGLSMKRNVKLGMACITLSAMFASCGQNPATTDNTVDYSIVSNEEDTNIQENVNENSNNENVSPKPDIDIESATEIILSDEVVTIQGEAATNDNTQSVYIANDIVYYEAGKDFTYGEGTTEDEHSKEEADLHTVVHITKPGTYIVSGKLSNGQIAIDLGEDAKKEPEAVVNLVLNGADISCSVAPAVIFYNVYECGSKDVEAATATVDTTAAGANVVIADGTVNNINGSYVARIYESVELNEEGTEVIDSKKLHKYDAAFYSKRSMNIYGGNEDTGVLNIKAENEGLDTELHLTLNGGNVNITSGNDGINTNEDNVSVTTINGGTLKIVVDGSTGEGDGIDSNGWLVINGGTVVAEACKSSMDAGIDSDKGIHINGGTVVATGNMLDHISESKQNYAVFNFAKKQSTGNVYTVKNDESEVIAECTPVNDFTYLIFSNSDLTEGTYTAWAGEAQLMAVAGDSVPSFGMGGGMPDFGNGEMPDFGNGERPNFEKREKPDETTLAELSKEFVITSQGNYFYNTSVVE